MFLLTLLAQAQDPVPADVSPDEEEVDEVVVVTATRSPSALGKAPVAVEVVTREELEATGAESLAEVLEEQPGLMIEDTLLGTAIRMQGMNPEHTLILVDGQRVLGRKDGVIDLSRFALDNIERIEIVKGPNSSLYGSDAMGGVVHIVTREPEQQLSAGLHMRGGTLGRVDITGDVSVGDALATHRVTAGYHQSDPWDLDPTDEATTSSGYHQTDVSYALSVKPDDDARMTLNASYMQRRMAGVDQTITGATLDTRQTIEDARAAAGGWWTPHANTKLSWRLSGSAYRAQQLSDQRGAIAGDNVTDEREHLGEASVQLDQVIGSNTLTVGMDGLHQDITSTRLSDGKGGRQRWAVFAQDVWGIGDDEGVHGMVSPGFRLDVDSQFGIAPAPRLATALFFGDFTVRASYGTGFRAPGFRELYLDFENPGAGYVIAGAADLAPERSRNLNASVSYATKPFDMSLQVYRNDIQDLITIVTVDQPDGADLLFTYANVAEALTQGIDAQVRWRPDPFMLELGYALTDARDKRLNRRIEGRVPHRLTGSTSVEMVDRLTVRAQAGYSSKRPYYVDENGDGAVETLWLPDRLTVDGRVSWKDGPLEVFGGVDNLFDVGQHTLAPTVPRFLYAGFTVRSSGD